MNGWNLSIGGRGEVYVHHIVTLANGDRRWDFVARFKYAAPKANANAFVKFLEKKFTPAEFFAARDAGFSPLTILEARGFVSVNVRRAMKVDSATRALFSTPEYVARKAEEAGRIEAAIRTLRAAA